MPLAAGYGTHSTLAGFAVRYRNFAYIADLVSPVVEVDANSQFYYKFGESDDFDEYETRTSEEGSVTESKSRRSQTSFTALDFAHSEFLPIKAREEADLLGVDDTQMVVERITDVVLRKREIAVAAELFKASNYTGMTATPGTKWGTATVKQITTDVNTGIDAMTGPAGGDRLILAMGLAAWRSLSTNANLLENIVPTKMAGQATPEQVAELLGVDEVVIGKAKRNTASKTETASPTRAAIWGDSALLCYRSAAPTVMGTTGHAVTFRRRVGGQAMAVYLIDEPRRGAHGGTLIKVAMTELPTQLVNAGQGYLLTAISA
jgi:hypothetical protein